MQSHLDQLTLDTDTLLIEEGDNIHAYATIERRETEAFLSLYRTQSISESEKTAGRDNFKIRISDKNTVALSITQNSSRTPSPYSARKHHNSEFRSRSG